ncbi:MAG: hypothetical protein WCN92_05330 [Eubacteriales bacterium]
MSSTWQKLTAWVMSAVMALLSVFVPGLAKPIEGISVGEWLIMVNEEFGMSTVSCTPTPWYADITAISAPMYFKDVQTAYDWGVINQFDNKTVFLAGLIKPVTTAFVATTLVRAANLAPGAGSDNADAAIAKLVGMGLLSLNIWGGVKALSVADVKALLVKVRAIWAEVDFGTPAVQAASQDEVKFSGDFAPAVTAAEIKTGAGDVLQDAYVPLGTEAGITQSQIDIAGLLKKLDVSFNLGQFNFNLKVTDTGFNLGVGTDITTGVHLQKSFEISNLNVSTKFDGNLATNDIKEAYLRADYDCKDVTTLTGNYATSLAVKGNTPMDLMTAAKAGALALMPGGGNKITVFTFSVPLGTTPFTVSLDVNLRITVDGKIQITIESSNVKGVEIINNKVRIINETTYGKQTYDVMADVRFTVGLAFGIKLVNYMLIDAEFEAGLGIKVSAYIQTDTAVYTLNMPLDLAINIPYPCGGMDGATFCGNAKIYGLMSVSVGQSSQLMKLAGLQKTWVIFDESNATIYNLHIEENGIVDQCTRARA